MMTPLNGIANFSELLMKGKIGERQIRKTAFLIKSSVKLLQCHTRDLLDLNLLETGVFEPNMRNQNIKHVIEEIVEIARMQASLQKIEIELDMRKIHLIKMQFDNQRFQKVL